MREEDVSGIRVSKQTKKRLSNLYPKFCTHGDDMDKLVNKMVDVCELLDEEQIEKIVRRK